MSGLFVNPATTRTHGIDENVGVKELTTPESFLYRLVKDLTSGK